MKTYVKKSVNLSYLQERRRRHGKFDEQARRALLRVLEQELIRFRGYA
jgi:hypothetical protein